MTTYVDFNGHPYLEISRTKTKVRCAFITGAGVKVKSFPLRVLNDMTHTHLARDVAQEAFLDVGSRLGFIGNAEKVLEEMEVGHGD